MTKGNARRSRRRKPRPLAFKRAIENPNDGQLFGFVWSGTTTATLEVRTQHASGWSDWIEVETEDMPDPALEKVRPGIGPIWAGDDAETLEFRVVEGELTDLSVEALHIDISGPSGGLPAAGAALNQPGIISRAEWGATPFGTNVADCGSTPSIARARMAVIHHTVHTNNYSPAQAYGIVKAIQTYEMTSRQFCDVAYNFIIDRFGQVFEGRTRQCVGDADRWARARVQHRQHRRRVARAVPERREPGCGFGHDAAVQPVARSPGVEVLVARYRRARVRVHDEQLARRRPTDTRTASGRRARRSCFPRSSVIRTSPGPRVPATSSCPCCPRLRAEVAERVITGGPFYPLDAVRWQPEGGKPEVATLDAFGGMHPAGGAGGVPWTGYWPGWGIARAAAGYPTAGWVLDGWGGVYNYGIAPPLAVSGYFSGWDIARSLAITPNLVGGYVLDGWGGVHPVGTAPPIQTPGYWYGWDIARDIALLPNGTGGYILDGWGGVHPFGGAPPVYDAPYWHGWDIARSLALNPDGPGGYVLDGWGGVYAFGGAPPVGITRWDPYVNHVDLVMLSGGRGYVADALGYLSPVGSAPPVTPSMTFNGYNIGRSVVAAG